MSDYNYRDAILKELANGNWHFEHLIFDAIEPECQLKQEAFERDINALQKEGLIECDSDEYTQSFRLPAPLLDPPPAHERKD